MNGTKVAFEKAGFRVLASKAFVGLSLLGSLLGMSGCATVGDEPLRATPHRPLFSTTTDTTPKGAVELEAGLLFDRHDTIDTPMLFKGGLSDTAEIFVGISPYLRVNTGDGYKSSFGDTLVGMQTRFIEEGDGLPAASVQFSTKIPTADEDRIGTNEEIDFFASAGVSKHFSESLRLGGSAGMEWLGDDLGDPDFGLRFGLYGVQDLVENFSVAGEFAARLNRTQNADEYLTNWAVIYELSPGFIFDAGTVIGLSNDFNEVQFYGGLTVLLGQPFIY